MNFGCGKCFFTWIFPPPAGRWKLETSSNRNFTDLVNSPSSMETSDWSNPALEPLFLALATGAGFLCVFFGYRGPSDENFGAWCWWSFTKSWSQLVFFGGILLLPSRESYQQNIPSRNQPHIPPNGKFGKSRLKIAMGYVGSREGTRWAPTRL